MFNPKDFTVSKAKPLPVLLLLDVSGSMSVYGKIDTLNDAVKDMLKDFANDKQIETEIQVSIVTFGSEIRRLFPFTPVNQITYDDLQTGGTTPLGECLRAAKAIIEDKVETPSRAYRPLVILVSDGGPTDDWEKPLEDFISSGRSKKCDRMALAIGEDADKTVLGKFITGTTNPLFDAHSRDQITKFFKLVTMSVTNRTHSQDPNQCPSIVSATVDASVKSISPTFGDDDLLDDCEF